MNENLQNSLAEIITRAIDTADTTTALITSELPDVAQEVLTYYSVTSFILCVVGLIVITPPIVLLFINAKKGWKEEKLIVINIIIGLVGGVVGITLISENIDWLQIWLSPKLYLIEYVGNLVK